MTTPPLHTLFPHTKLDWTISRLEDRIHGSPDDPASRIELARAVLSRGLYHSGGEQDCNRALALARKALNDDPSNAEALVLAGLSLIGIDRPKAATRYLDQAVRIDGERADLRLALGRLDLLRDEAGQAVRQLESACRLAADSWETHLELGHALLDLARRKGHPKRLVERAQYHFVQTLKRDPAPDQLPLLLRDLGITCMLTGRHKEAEKFFLRLREQPKYAALARFHLGLVAYELGKYNNAIQHFRQYLREKPDDPKVLARMAMAWFQLGEYPRAREACHQALLADPDDVLARHALGCTLLEEGEPNEALRVFREALKDHPGHLPSYIELARARRIGGDVRWLVMALESEVGGYDRLPPGGADDARGRTRERVRVILDELRAVGPSTVGPMLATIDRSQDEALRFQLWEAACNLSTSQVADAASVRLREPGRHFGVNLGGLALSAAPAVPEPVLISGLQLEESDLKRAAVDRYPPAHDVTAHRRNLDAERNGARAYQALLLLSIGLRRSAAGKELLRRWAEVADPELSVAAWAALAMYGEPEATRRLHDRAVLRGATAIVDHLLNQVTPPSGPARPRRVSDGEETRCSTCNRQPGEVTHMMAGGDVVICDKCVLKISHSRASMAAPDDATCKLCGRSPFEVSGLFRLGHVDICSNCLQFSLGMLEREEVDRFLTTW
jgi:tetratricopeptide (TPR) repeat protein